MPLGSHRKGVMGMPEWLWGATFIAVLLAIALVADWHAKRHYRRPAHNLLIRPSHAERAPASHRASS